MRTLERERPASARGQTTLDFAFGIGVFLLVLAFIVMFIPDMIAPFNTPGEDGDKIQAERTADHLVAHVLADESSHTQVTTLDSMCTDSFFDPSTTPPSQCRFTESLYSGDTLDSTALGLDSTTHIRVQLQTLDGAVEKTVGESSPPARNLQQWSRIVSVADQQYSLRVQVW